MQKYQSFSGVISVVKVVHIFLLRTKEMKAQRYHFLNYFNYDLLFMLFLQISKFGCQLVIPTSRIQYSIYNIGIALFSVIHNMLITERRALSLMKSP